jgi:hypothetical protein
VTKLESLRVSDGVLVLVSLDDLPGNLETTWISSGQCGKGSKSVNRKSEKVEERCWCSSVDREGNFTFDIVG